VPKVKVGDRFTTNEGYEVEVVEYRSARDVVIRFDDEFGCEVSVEAGNLRKGWVKNPYSRSVLGVGYYGIGPRRAKIDGKVQRVYNRWKSMFTRCYYPDELSRHPTYAGCTVAEEWHNFQVFAEWYYQQPNHDKQGFHLDKDLLVTGNKVYGPDFCSFVPNRINKLLTNSARSRGKYPQGVSKHRKDGKYYASLCVDNRQKCLGGYATPEEAVEVYREAKERYVREQAEKYKDVLHHKVYYNLMNYSLEELEKE
jgi:hypothetical protein